MIRGRYDRCSIYPDNPTSNFLQELPALLYEVKGSAAFNKSAGILSLAERVGTCWQAFYMYATKRTQPSLKTFIKLSEYFRVDLTDSINYKVYYGIYPIDRLREKVNQYFSCYEELGAVIRYDRVAISKVLGDCGFFGISQDCKTSRGSLQCLGAIDLAVRKREAQELA